MSRRKQRKAVRVPADMRSMINGLIALHLAVVATGGIFLAYSLASSHRWMTVLSFSAVVLGLTAAAITFSKNLRSPAPEKPEPILAARVMLGVAICCIIAAVLVAVS